jgi:hypothetical protein
MIEVSTKKCVSYIMLIFNTKNGAAERNRTSDPVITNDVLYH